MIVELVRSADWSVGCRVGQRARRQRVCRCSGPTNKLLGEGRRVLAWWPHIRNGDAHAGESETSMMLALAPTLVRMSRAEAGRPEPIVDLIDELRANGVRAVSPNGVLGDPRRATANARQDAADPTDHRPRRGRRRVAIVTDSFQLDGSYRRYDRVVIAGSPLRLFRSSAGGQRVRRGDRAEAAVTCGSRQADRSVRRCRRDPSRTRRSRRSLPPM